MSECFDAMDTRFAGPLETIVSIASMVSKKQIQPQTQIGTIAVFWI